MTSLQNIYRRNVFPVMKVTFGTYPDNLGHITSSGCFRCHDGGHTAKDGTTISAECEYCHKHDRAAPVGRDHARVWKERTKTEGRVRARWMFVTLLLLVPTLTVRAGDQTLLIYLEERSAAFPNAVSASGAVVVGGLGTGGGFYWMPTTGTVFIGGLGATNISRDGRTIVGQVLDSRAPAGRHLDPRGGVEGARIVYAYGRAV